MCRQKLLALETWQLYFLHMNHFEINFITFQQNHEHIIVSFNLTTRVIQWNSYTYLL